ncbi:MAG: Fe-S cluster assembly protein SufD [Proteobacteria bacterium]|nr:Fe-S cluster assembly protein SufD [Pseudomonadota bacterium]
MSASATWLDERRAQARERFAAQGVPHRRIEDWKYSDLRPAVEGANDDAAAAWSIRMRPDGVEVFDLAQVDAPDWVRAHLGTLPQSVMASASLAQARSGFAVRVPRNLAAGTLDFEWKGAGSGRALIVLEEGATLTLCENTRTVGFANLGVEAIVGANAQLTHVRIASRATAAVQVEEYAVQVARDGLYRAHLFNGGAKLSRAEFQIVLAGTNARAALSGVSVLADGAHADVTTHITHAVGHTESTQLFKKVAGGASRAIYQGRITVEQGADKSDSRQTAKALLMGVRAEADLKPELEIFADDVKCAHGAAVGDLDADSLFYLRARGIPEAEARNLLVHAFLDEVVTGIADDEMRKFVRAMVEEALPGAMLP